MFSYFMYYVYRQTELKHYENRLLKVRHLTGELLRLRKTGGDDDDLHPDTDVRLEQKLAEVIHF